MAPRLHLPIGSVLPEVSRVPAKAHLIAAHRTRPATPAPAPVALTLPRKRRFA